MHERSNAFLLARCGGTLGHRIYCLKMHGTALALIVLSEFAALAMNEWPCPQLLWGLLSIQQRQQHSISLMTNTLRTSPQS